MLDRDERLIVCRCPQIVLRKDAQAASGYLEPACDADLQFVELDFAVEPGAQGFDHATFQDWAGVGEDNLNDNDEDSEGERGDRNTAAQNT